MSDDPSSRGLAHTSLILTTSLSPEEITVQCDVSLVVTMSRIRSFNVSGILLRVQLESAMAFIDRERVETQTSCGELVGLDYIVKRIPSGLNKLIALWVTSSLVSKLESIEPA